jgi:transposase-like protein
MNENVRICGCNRKESDSWRRCVRFGRFFRTSDGVWVQRYRCIECSRTFSEATHDPCFKQHKRKFNSILATFLVSGVSQRRLAIVFKINRKTVVRKFIFTGTLAKDHLARSNLTHPLSAEIQFDDLETIEHTKLKPLSVTLAVEKKTRRILGFEVSQMACTGKLARLSQKKYGKRHDHRPRGRKNLFRTLQRLVKEDVLIESDQNPHYISDVQTFFPNCNYTRHKGQRGSIAGQGELKKIRFDPLFSLNHTCAMLRANINRLFRKTWCTTKKRERLELHISLYAIFHNLQLKQIFY